MKTDIETLEQWMRKPENENLEFKRGQKQFDSEKLTHYCVALANEGGGKLIIGVTDKPPRKVVGTKAISDIGKKRKELLDRLRLRIDLEEIQHPDGRVVVALIKNQKFLRRNYIT